MMNKLQIFAMCMVLLITAIPVCADNDPGALAAPEWVRIGERGANQEYMWFDWEDVRGATKYSLDIEAEVTYFDKIEGVRKTAEVELSFGTSDRTDGRDMSDSDLAIAKADLRQAVLDALGLTDETVGPMSLDAMAKVKALSPGKNKGRQNNPFSEKKTFKVVL